MHGLTSKFIITSLLSLLIALPGVTNAGINPFKKSKNYNFGADVPWYESRGSVTKSGSVRDGPDTNYYHLNIDKYRLLLRLGKNDPSGELANTRSLGRLAIAEVKADGRRLPIFDWCLSNQHNVTKKLKQNTVVVNDTCINAGGGGDFVINLDEQTKQILKTAKTLTFIVEPYGRPVMLSYNMSGFAELMASLNVPIPAAVVKEPKPVAPVAAVKAKPKPKPVKMCYEKAPTGFQSAVTAIAYPCNNTVKKANAKAKISARVKQEKKKMAMELEAANREKLARQKAVENNKRKIEWDIQQAKIWVKRCEKHWAKGKSPCYCEKYIDKAPAGITSSCGK